MKQGTYIRTQEVKKKQSESMKKRYNSDDFDHSTRVIAYKATVEEKRLRGEKVGRKSKREGGIFNTKGTSKPCPVCSKLVYYTPKQLLENKIKCCSRECLFKDDTYRNKLRNIDKSYMLTDEYRNKKTNPNTPAYTKYARRVRKISELNYVIYQDLINPNNYPRTLCGVEGGYQLDHIKSIKECWNEGISPEEAAKYENLRLITWQENLNRRKFDPIL